jgi:hypothetical protein
MRYVIVFCRCYVWLTTVRTVVVVVVIIIIIIIIITITIITFLGCNALGLCSGSALLVRTWLPDSFSWFPSWVRSRPLLSKYFPIFHSSYPSTLYASVRY